MSTSSTSVSYKRDDLFSNPDVLLRLRRLNSATSSTTSLKDSDTLPAYNSTTSLLPSAYPNDHKLSLDGSDSSSILDIKSLATRPFHISKSFQINALGKKLVSLPLASGELETSIDELGVEGQPLGTFERYRSIRPERKKGNCTLFLNDNVSADVSRTPVTETTYRFGLGKPPVIKCFGLGAETRGEIVDEFELNGLSTFTRTVVFESKRFGKLQWRYASKKEKRAWKEEGGATSSIKSNPTNLLVLEKVIKEGDRWKGTEREVVEVARMVRNEECRAKGTSGSDEGNGGRLEIDFEALLIGGIGGATELMEWAGDQGKREIEALVTATVLVMLKKEIDRLRALQIAFISGVIA